MNLSADDEQSLAEDELYLQREGTVPASQPPLDMDPPPSAVPRVPLPPPPRFSQFQKPAAGMPRAWSSGPPAASMDTMPFQPGEILAGKYQVDRLAGRMGEGFVVHVRHMDLGQRFILKCLSLEACRYPDAVAKFLRGARAAMRLSSEFTARTIDAGRLASGAPYVVSEALAGCDLREMIRIRGALTISEACDFVLQAAESLAEAHSFGMVHKNLNLSTLFSTRRPDGSPRIKVLDFGVAEALRADPMRANELSIDATTVFGSNPMVEALACSSPEQLRNNVDIDARSDIWALGAVLHEMLCGHPVYRAETVPGLLAMIAADSPTPVTALRTEVPARLESAILRCLEKDKNARFATVAELGVALRDFATPDAQSGADRITRTLGRRARQPYPASTSALVHVGPAPTPPAPERASFPPPSRRSHIEAPSGASWFVWSTLLVAFGLVGGTIAGVLVATRTGMQGMLQRAPSEQAVAAVQAETPRSPSAAVTPSASIQTVAPGDGSSAATAPSDPEPKPEVASSAGTRALAASADAAARAASADAVAASSARRARARRGEANAREREARDSKVASASPSTEDTVGKDLFDTIR